jgi:hypothetical protein
MNKDIWSIILHNYLQEEHFYIITLFDKSCGIILTQDIAAENTVLDIIYNRAESSLANKYPRKTITLENSGITSKKYYLHQIFDINQKEINDTNFCIFVKKCKIHI